MDENYLGMLNYIANVSQLLDLGLNFSQTSNDQLMKELQKQNKEYLEKIISNQEKIISLLKNMNL